MQRNRSKDWDAILDSAKSGDFSSIPADVLIHCYNSLSRIRSDFARPSGVEKEVHVFWGDTGTGKSRDAWQQAGVDAYPKNPRTKWWDGYRSQECVVIDEFRGDIDVANLLRWFDRYPVLVEIKGSSLPLQAKQIWITSNLSPRQWYPTLDEKTVDALLRRLNVIHYNKKLG